MVSLIDGTGVWYAVAGIVVDDNTLDLLCLHVADSQNEAYYKKNVSLHDFCFFNSSTFLFPSSAAGRDSRGDGAYRYRGGS